MQNKSCEKCVWSLFSVWFTSQYIDTKYRKLFCTYYPKWEHVTTEYKEGGTEEHFCSKFKEKNNGRHSTSV